MIKKFWIWYLILNFFLGLVLLSLSEPKKKTTIKYNNSNNEKQLILNEQWVHSLWSILVREVCIGYLLCGSHAFIPLLTMGLLLSLHIYRDKELELTSVGISYDLLFILFLNQDLQSELDSIESDGVGNYCFWYGY